ncbi:alpha/beta fold hydrolase [Pseudomonas sp. MPFS]|uniref:alpha/beta hydrolase n=1 Tax=Pseudomonas sp. MPFS TaxID=2795724 RepID=UPI001F1471B4|nr:alpha/beta fold hydrolase [Pseudomonas sp. MPFS]UMZ12089.1 alpha/beta fold hydrolase [Pseudomonas sp. MPFS]
MLKLNELRANVRTSKAFCGSLLLAAFLLPGAACADQTTAPAAAPRVEVSSARISTAPRTIVFIHGMFMTPKAWDNWQAYFQARGYTTLAPAWPLHEGPIQQQWSEASQARLGKLTLDEVVESYRQVLRRLPEKPIVIGHSMGGLVAQKLLAEGLAAQAVAIDSAPASGLIVLQWSFIRSNWPVISPFAPANKAYAPSLESFRYAFANCLPDAESEFLYRNYIVPESRLVGRATSEKVAEIDFSQRHGPLLMLAGENDNIIPASLNLKNFGKYSDESSVTNFHKFNNQCHALIVDKHWKDVADYVGVWLENQ